MSENPPRPISRSEKKSITTEYAKEVRARLEQAYDQLLDAQADYELAVQHSKKLSRKNPVVLEAPKIRAKFKKEKQRLEKLVAVLADLEAGEIKGGMHKPYKHRERESVPPSTAFEQITGHNPAMSFSKQGMTEDFLLERLSHIREGATFVDPTAAMMLPHLDGVAAPNVRVASPDVLEEQPKEKPTRVQNPQKHKKSVVSGWKSVPAEQEQPKAEEYTPAGAEVKVVQIEKKVPNLYLNKIREELAALPKEGDPVNMYLEDQDLFERIVDGPPLPYEEAQELYEDIAARFVYKREDNYRELEGALTYLFRARVPRPLSDDEKLALYEQVRAGLEEMHFLRRINAAALTSIPDRSSGMGLSLKEIYKARVAQLKEVAKMQAEEERKKKKGFRIPWRSALAAAAVTLGLGAAGVAVKEAADRTGITAAIQEGEDLTFEQILAALTQENPAKTSLPNGSDTRFGITELAEEAQRTPVDMSNPPPIEDTGYAGRSVPADAPPPQTP